MALAPDPGVGEGLGSDESPTELAEAIDLGADLDSTVTQAGVGAGAAGSADAHTPTDTPLATAGDLESQITVDLTASELGLSEADLEPHPAAPRPQPEPPHEPKAESIFDPAPTPESRTEPGSAHELDLRHPPDPTPQVEADLEADPFAWPTAAELAQHERTDLAARPLSPANPVSPTQGGATPTAEQLLGGQSTDSDGKPADFPSLIDFASSPAATPPTEPITDHGPESQAAQPITAQPETAQPETTEHPVQPGLTTEPQTPQARAGQSAIEQSPWPDLPMPPVTKNAPLIAPPDDGSDLWASDPARPSTRIERPLRRRPLPSSSTEPTTTGGHSDDVTNRLDIPQPTSTPARTPDAEEADPRFDPQAAVDTQTIPLSDLAGPEHQAASLSAAAPPAPNRPTVWNKDALGPQTADQEQGGVFYGWILVGAVFFIMAISSGLGFYNASVILAAARIELDASVGAVSGGTGLFFAISGLTGFVFSKQLDSVDVRWFFAIGGLVGAIALVGLQWVTSVPRLYIFFALFGVGFSLAGLVPGTTLVTRWFDRRRSVALSVASAGLSVGGIVVTPIAAWLIDKRDLAGASPYMAAMWIIGIVPIALLLVRSYPSEKGLRPDGEPPVDAGPAQQDRNQPEDQIDQTADGNPDNEVVGLDFVSARSTRFFGALCVAYAVIFFGQVGAIAQLFNMILERSDNGTARLALATLAATSVIARLAGGAIVLRMPTKSFTAMLTVLQAGALVLLALASSAPALVVSSALFGVSIGNLLMLQPLLLAEAFGVRNYGRIYSFNQLFGTLGVAGGPFALGVLRDEFDYRTAFYVAAAASLTGFVFLVLAGPTNKVQSLWRPSAA